MASGGQYVTHTGPTVMPASYADNSDWGEGSLTETDMFHNTRVKMAGGNLGYKQ